MSTSKNRIKNGIKHRGPVFWILLAAVIVCVIAAVCLLTSPKSGPARNRLSSGSAKIADPALLEALEDCDAMVQGILFSAYPVSADPSKNVRVYDSFNQHYDPYGDGLILIYEVAEDYFGNLSRCGKDLVPNYHLYIPVYLAPEQVVGENPAPLNILPRYADGNEEPPETYYNGWFTGCWKAWARESNIANENYLCLKLREPGLETEEGIRYAVYSPVMLSLPKSAGSREGMKLTKALREYALENTKPNIAYGVMRNAYAENPQTIWYTAEDTDPDGRQPYAPTTSPEASGGGAELLLGQVKREKINSVVYTMSIGDHYTLLQGEEGFEQVLDTLFSLRGTPCEKPAALVSRHFELGSSGLQVSLAFDGERVYGSSFLISGTGWDQWYRLDGEGRTDQALTELFLRFGEKEVSVSTLASQNRGMLEDAAIVLTAESADRDLPSVLSSLERWRTECRENGKREADPGFIVRLLLENRSENSVCYDNAVELEAFRDGEWRLIPMRNGYGYMGVGLCLEPGATDPDNLGIALASYYEEALIPGLYRACLRYSFEEGAFDHVAYAEFTLTDETA